MADKDRNEKPHLLTAKVEAYGRYKGISWGIQCPYEPQDIRDCGVVEECTGSEADVAKYGCRPYPVEPKFPQGHTPDAELPEEFRLAWRAWEDEVTEWQCAHYYYGGGSYGHRVGDCWFTHILGEGDVEPEGILENIPDNTPINGPFKVEVHYEGSYDETSPSFTLWKEPDGNPS
jgi:hypothetical protein